MKGSIGGGEIVQVQGGHIVKSTGRKDRHSKVYTAKGPRDRRVRLSAHTAIQFYDVQDRLGYDRPSKAVDWLMKKAKSAIDKLDELPPWNPIPNTSNNGNMETDQNGGSSEMGIGADQSESSAGYSFHQIHNQNTDSSSFITQSIDPDDVIPDTMKSLFPTTSNHPSSMNFHGYPSDLGLSLHSFQDHGHGHGHTHHHHHHASATDENIFAGSGSVGYEPNFSRMVGWSNNNNSTNNNNNNNTTISAHQALLGQDDSAAFSQRGTLQSSFAAAAAAAQSFRAWNDLTMASEAPNHHRSQDLHHPSFIFGSRFAASGFSIPARIHGEEDQTDHHRPSSSSPNSQP